MSCEKGSREHLRLAPVVGLREQAAGRPMFSNRYIQRRVASTDSRACFLCYKPTSSVMVQEDQSDFFYACDAHLKDPGFAALDAASQEAERKKREREAQIEELKREWQEKSKKSGSKKDDSKSKDADAETEKDAPSPPDLQPLAPTRKVYELHKGIMNLRFNAKKRAAQERRTKTLLETPGMFPKAPSHKPK